MLLDGIVLADKLTGAIGSGLGDPFWGQGSSIFEILLVGLPFGGVSPSCGSARASLPSDVT